jgi:hypothetical protein
MATSYALQTVSYITSSFLGQIFVIGNSVRFRRVIQPKPKPECQHTREKELDKESYNVLRAPLLFSYE